MDVSMSATKYTDDGHHRVRTSRFQSQYVSVRTLCNPFSELSLVAHFHAEVYIKLYMLSAVKTENRT